MTQANIDKLTGWISDLETALQQYAMGNKAIKISADGESVDYQQFDPEQARKQLRIYQTRLDRLQGNRSGYGRYRATY